MENKSKRLGKGLMELLGEDYLADDLQNEAEYSSDKESIAISKISYISTDLLFPNSKQPRKEFNENKLKELAFTLKSVGMLQPIVVSLPNEQNKSMIIAGERRWRAAQIAGLHEVPVIIKDVPRETLLQIAMIENIQREDLNPVEEAEGYKRLVEQFDYTHDQIANVVAKSRSYISNMLRIADASPILKDALLKGDITIGHAKILVGIEDVQDLINNIKKSQLSVRQTERLLQKQKGNIVSKKNIDEIALENDLSSSLKLPVRISCKKNKTGNIAIYFDNLNQLDEICNRLCSKNIPL